MERFKNQRYLIIAMAVVMVIFLVLIRIYQTGAATDDEINQISIVAYGTDTDRWENLKQGASVACSGLNAEVFLVTMSENAGAAEQAKIVKREIENGAAAVIIAADDSAGLSEYLGINELKTPVVFAETGIDDKEHSCVSADNYSMGVKLADKIIENEHKWVKVAIVADNLKRSSVSGRYQGVYDTVKKYTDNVVVWDRNINESSMITRKYLQRWLVEEAVDVIVTLDSEKTDALMDALDNLNKSGKVYSIANSDKAVSYLDHGKITALEYQDEFAIGYVAAVKALDAMDLKAPKIADEEIGAKVMTKGEIYKGDNEKLVFPFAK